MKTWFKFYGQEYLSDPKMMSLTPIERALWLTVLCLASASDEEGVIKHIDQYKIMTLTGILPFDDEWEENEKFLEKFETLGMITNDNAMITIKSFIKRQEQNLSTYERVKKHREKVKIEAKNDNKVKRYHDNAREEKNREEKNIKEIYKENSLSYLQNIPQEDTEEFIKQFTCTKGQVNAKGLALYDYCKSKGKTYKDYKALMRNALRKDFGDRKVAVQSDANNYEIDENGIARLKELKKNFKLGGIN